jgi:hypothetical protein
MSNYFQVSISVSYLIIFHQESKNIVFIREAPTEEFDPRFLEDLRRAIQFEEIELPQAEGDISQGTVKQKYVVLRAGKSSTVVLIINQKPNRFTREALHSFGIRFESRWGREIKDLYTNLEGNIELFRQDTDTRQSVTKLVDEIFHLDFTLPHKLGLPMVQLKGAHKKVWALSEELARGSGYVLLGELLTTAQEKLTHDKAEIPDIIYDFVSRGFMSPIPMEQFIAQYAKKR